jgi:hypothetical protein
LSASSDPADYIYAGAGKMLEGSHSFLESFLTARDLLPAIPFFLPFPYVVHTSIRPYEGAITFRPKLKE